MTKIDSWMIFLLSCIFMGAVSFIYPWIFGDKNSFLNNFVNHEFLNFMAVVVTITLASTANIHIELKKIEDKAGGCILGKTKSAVRKSAFSLIWALTLSVVLVVAKPLLPETELASSLANSFAIALIIWGILVIFDITKLAFKL